MSYVVRLLSYVRFPAGVKRCQSGSTDLFHELQLRRAYESFGALVALIDRGIQESKEKKRSERVCHEQACRSSSKTQPNK